MTLHKEQLYAESVQWEPSLRFILSLTGKFNDFFLRKENPLSSHNYFTFQTVFSKKCHRETFSHVMQCAAVNTQLGEISVPPQVGKKDSRETYK